MRSTKGGGFYTVMISNYDGRTKIPYVVFATSDWQAARLVREETGCVVGEKEVEGPYLFCA